MTSVRRSTRDRKPVHYNPDATLKRKHASDDEDLSDASSGNGDAYVAKVSNSNSTRRAARSAAPQRPTKRTRTSEATSKPARKPRGTAAAATHVTSSDIADDNPLFNAVLNPSAALQSTVQDFLQSLEFNPNQALAELVTFVLRACGSSDSVNADQVVDSDGIVDMLDHYTEALKHIDSPLYPLTSKLPKFKKFRKHLSEFLGKLVSSSAEMGSLYNTDLMEVLKEWITSMSSSQIRSFRHTATVVVLDVQTALCKVASSLESEADRVGRQREGNKKRKATTKGGSAKGKDLEEKADQLRTRRTHIANFLKEFFTGVFIHRYRDTDPLIRADCVKSLGEWFEKFPSEFLNGTYMRYVGWVLSDPSSSVRMEAVNALDGVYSQSDYTHGLSHFTERFKPRLIQMAKGDTDVHIRVAVITVLSSIDEQSLLDDDERQELCGLIMDPDVKVRQVVAHFVKSVWEEIVETQLTGVSKLSTRDKNRVGYKLLASLLLQLCRNERSSDDEDSPSQNGDAAGPPLPGFVDRDGQSRTTLVIRSLWGNMDILHDWEGLLDLLLQDHSAAEGSNESLPRKGKSASAEANLNELSRLSDEEESFLLEAVHPILTLMKEEAAGGKNDEGEKMTNEISRSLIKALPRLFIKHQTDNKRTEHVLRLPDIMNLDMYVDMRMVSNYAALWDDLLKQFLSHSSLTVLQQAMATMSHCLATTSLAKTNSEKVLELEEELSTSLRNITGGREELHVTTFTDDEVLTLTAVSTRISVLCASRDMCDWIAEDEGGQQSSAWDIFSALVDRGRLGYQEEESLFECSTQILMSYILWKYKRLVSVPDNADQADEALQESLAEQRGVFVQKLYDMCIGEQSNATARTKLAAFRHYLDMEILFSGADDSSLQLLLDDETQYRCAGFMQAKVEGYANQLYERQKRPSNTADDEDDDEPEDFDIEPDWSKSSRSELVAEYSFMEVVFTFIRSLFSGTIHPQHGAILLPYYSRLGPQYDQSCKRVLHLIRDISLKSEHPEILVDTVTQATQEAFKFSLRHRLPDSCLSQLTKLLASAFTLRGTHLTILKKLSSSHIAEIHKNLIRWLCHEAVSYQKHDKPLNKLVGFFRFLSPLMPGLESRDALAVKAFLNQIVAEKNLATSSDEWDAFRGYEKKLGSTLTKGNKKRRKKAPGDEDGAVSTENESDSDHPPEAEEQSGDEGAPAPTQPRPRRVTRQTGGTIRSSPVVPMRDENGDGEEGEHTEPPGSEGSPEPEHSSSVVPVSPVPATPDVSQSPHNKRPLSDMEEDQEQEPEEGSGPTAEQDDEIIIPKRKRIRY